MRRAIFIWSVVAIITVADLTTFVLCVPPVCQAWGTSRVGMSVLFLGLVVWVQSLSNIWRTALVAWTPASALIRLRLPMTDGLPPKHGGDTNV